MMLVRRANHNQPEACQALAPGQLDVLEDCSDPAHGQYEFVSRSGLSMTRAWLCDDHATTSKALTGRNAA